MNLTPSYFLIAGQSNAQSTAKQHRPHYSRTGQVSILMPPQWNMISPSQSNPITDNIAWLYFGDLWATFTQRPVVIINVAHGSMSTAKWAQDKSLFYLLRDALCLYPINGILWVQGESDVLEKISYDDGLANMRWLIRESSRHSSAPWFVAHNSLLWHEEPPIRRVQNQIIADGLAYEGPDLDTLRHNSSCIDQSGIEFHGDGLCRHGELWFDCLSQPENLARLNISVSVQTRI